MTKILTPARSGPVLAHRPSALARPLSSVGHLQRTLGNATLQSLVQAKLKISRPGDREEQEADRIADQVIQRKAGGCHCGGTCDTCSESTVDVARSATSATPAAAAPSTRVLDGLGSGRALDRATRGFFESQLGHDLSGVRVHTDAGAAATASAIDARAFTAGHDVVFGPGEYAPGTARGDRLLAHELVHVMQQREGRHGADVMRDDKKGTVTVTLMSTGACKDPRLIAEAIPGAKQMSWTAFNWFLDYPFMDQFDQAKVNKALRVCFGDASADTRQTVKMRVLRINQLLESAQAGGITFACEPAGDESCKTGEWDRAGYVKRNERDIIHVCPAFFAEGLEFRRWNLIHECAHLAGAKGPETYYFYFDEVDCDTPTELKTSEALENADSYSRLIWCLSRARGTPFSPVKPI